MKKLYLLMAALLLTVALAACGTQNNDDGTNADQADEGTVNNEDQNNGNNTDDQNDDENMDNEDNTTDNNNETDAASDDDMKQKMDELDYIDFEVSVDYGKNKEYEAKIEKDDDDNNGIEEDVEDDLNNVNLNRQEAFNKIYPKVKKLTIDANTSKKDAIMEVLKAFELDPDYNEFELELKFKDGKKVEFEDRK